MRVGIITFSQIATFLIVLSLGLPISSEAGVFWAEDFEHHLTPNWDTSACPPHTFPGPQDGCNGHITTAPDLVHGGSHSSRGDYDPVCGTTDTGGCGTYYDRSHPSVDEVYTRVYYRTTAFSYHQAAGTKHWFHIQSPRQYPELFFINLNGSRELGAQLSTGTSSNFFCQSTQRLDSACNYHPNMAHVPLNDNHWYCIETHVKLNTAGQSNSALEIWIDGVQTMGHYGEAWRIGGGNNNSLTAQFSALRYYTQLGVGTMYYDDLAVGNTRIGCSGTPQSDVTPPAPPFGLSVR